MNSLGQTTMVFDSVDADKTPVRLLNVNGTYQSVSYVPKDLRAELAVEYHRLMADFIAQATATPQPTPTGQEEPQLFHPASSGRSRSLAYSDPGV